jgi:hypothetical protein
LGYRKTRTRQKAALSDRIRASSPSFISNGQIMIGLTSIPGAALKDIRLTDQALFMAMHNNGIQWCLASGASLLVRVGWV